MGQSKGGGYQKLDVNTPEQSDALRQILQFALGNQQAAAEGFKQFLPGGGGGEAIKAQANKNFEQQSIPAIMNAFGRGSKGSSALNQALASGGANLNTDLASQLSQMSLNAASGLGGLGTNQGNQGLGPQFAYQQKQQPFWQSALLGAINAGGQAGRAYLGGGF